MRYPEFMMITYGWYLDRWWTQPATSDEYDCTAEEVATVLPYTLAAIQRESPTNLDAKAEPDIVSISNVVSYLLLLCMKYTSYQTFTSTPTGS